MDPRFRDRRHAADRVRRSRRLVWIGPICLVAILLLATTSAEIARRQSRAVGVGLEETADGLQVTWVDPGGPAAAAGVEAGDVLSRVGGREVLDFPSYDVAASTFVRGASVDFDVRRGGEQRVLELSPGRPFPWSRTLVEWLACLGYLAVGCVALVQLPRDLRARLLMLLSLSVALELAMPVELLDLPDYGRYSMPFLVLLIGFQIGLELHLAASIPSRRRFGRHRRWIVPSFYAAGGLLAVQLAVMDLVTTAGWEPRFWSVSLAEELFWNVGSVLWAAAFVALLGSAAVKCPDPLARQQTLFVLLAGLPWSIHVGAAVVTEWLGGIYPSWLEIVEPLVLLVFPLGILLAIFRYQLFDLEVVVRRGLVYTALTGGLILGFYLAIGVGGALLTRFLPGGDPSIWLVGFATLVMGLLFGPLRKLTQRLINRHFFPERAALRKQLIRLASDLPSSGSLPSMGKELVDKLCDLFGVETATVLLGAESGILSPLASSGTSGRAVEGVLLPTSDPAVAVLRRSGRPLSIEQLVARSPSFDGKLTSLEPEMLVPVLRHDRLIGILVLGRKLAGRSFPAEEMELLQLISHHVATAFEYSQLYESATRDSLTGLLRRGAVLDALNRELDRSVRFGRPLAVAIADIDDFKDVNDRYGHLKGDLVLKRVARALASGLRLTDEVGRYGGEEFLVVLPETDAEGVRVVAEKLRQLVEEVDTTADNGEEIRVTISLGVAAIDQYAAASRRPEVNELIAAADAALYEAKTGGRNRVEVRSAIA